MRVRLTVARLLGAAVRGPAGAVCLGLLLAHGAWAQVGPGRMVSQMGTPADQKFDLLRDVKFDQQLDAQVPLDLPFRDETGKTVRLGDYFGTRPVVLALVYYECPMLCSQVLTGLVSALDVLTFDAGREFEVVVVSFNEKDSPRHAAEKKAAYTERYNRPGTEGAWHFLTGPPASIAQLTQAVGFKYVWDEETKQFAHAAGAIVLTPAGRVSKYFFGIEYSARDLKFGIMQAAEQKVGTAVDQLLLYCYHYDPLTGKYGLVAMTLVRIGGALTVLALAAFWFVSWLRGRQGARLAGAGHGA
jgi:protein SCO1/2